MDCRFKRQGWANLKGLGIWFGNEITATTFFRVLNDPVMFQDFEITEEMSLRWNPKGVPLVGVARLGQCGNRRPKQCKVFMMLITTNDQIGLDMFHLIFQSLDPIGHFNESKIIEGRRKQKGLVGLVIMNINRDPGL